MHIYKNQKPEVVFAASSASCPQPTHAQVAQLPMKEQKARQLCLGRVHPLLPSSSCVSWPGRWPHSAWTRLYSSLLRGIVVYCVHYAAAIGAYPPESRLHHPSRNYPIITPLTVIVRAARQLLSGSSRWAVGLAATHPPLRYVSHQSCLLIFPVSPPCSCPVLV